jgi:hypothetical protein
VQKTFALTDDETVDQFALILECHYSLNITEESDAAAYVMNPQKAKRPANGSGYSPSIRNAGGSIRLKVRSNVSGKFG